MPLTEPDLWNLIRTWPLPDWDETDYGVTPARRTIRFEDSLRKAGNWTDNAVEEITDAYRRFLYLKALTGETLTPPSWIDEAWHQHLAFPSNYAHLEARLGRKIHHRQRMAKQERTAGWDRGRELWKAEFDFEPPPKMWPPRLAWWRPRVGLCVMIFVVATSAWFLNSEWFQLLPVSLAILVPTYWGACYFTALFFFSGPQPDRISDWG
jgi:hypothetical protein